MSDPKRYRKTIGEVEHDGDAEVSMEILVAAGATDIQVISAAYENCYDDGGSTMTVSFALRDGVTPENFKAKYNELGGC